ILRAMGETGVAMRELIGAKLLERGFELGLVIAERLRLAAVMLVDYFLDRDRAGHRRALAEERRRGAQGVARDMPQRRQHRRPHATLDDEPVEGIEMALLLLGHAADDRCRGGAAEHRELAVIDALRAIFAGVIDADHAGQLFPARGIARQTMWTAHAASRCAAPRLSAPTQKTVRTMDASRFQPASVTPNSDHCGSSQLTGGRAISRALKSARSPPAETPPVHAVGPTNQCCSTPT